MLLIKNNREEIMVGLKMPWSEFDLSNVYNNASKCLFCFFVMKSSLYEFYYFFYDQISVIKKTKSVNILCIVYMLDFVNIDNNGKKYLAI